MNNYEKKTSPLTCRGTGGSAMVPDTNACMCIALHMQEQPRGGRPAMVAVSTQPLSINSMGPILSETASLANASHNTYLGAKANLCIAPTSLQIEHSIHRSLSIFLEGGNGRPIPGSRGAWKYVPSSAYFCCENKQLTLLQAGALALSIRPSRLRPAKSSPSST